MMGVAEAINDFLEHSEWTNDYRIVAFFFSMLWFGIYVLIGNRNGVDWHSVSHSVLVGLGSIYCTYMNIFEAESISGMPEPLRTIRCEGPLTPLHSFIPVVALGYAVSDIIYGFQTGSNDFIFHGACMGTVLLIVCELEMQHSVISALLMYVSSFALNLMEADFFNATGKLVCSAIFAILFFLIRIIVVPYTWFQFLTTLYYEIQDGTSTSTSTSTSTTESCFPKSFIYIVFVFGMLFHGLNLYWLRLIIRKVQRKLQKLHPKEKDSMKKE